MTATEPDPWSPDLDEFLGGAVDIAHPGGTLAEHLDRVALRLHQLDAPPRLVAAGRTHAAYGTDGFAPSLLDHQRHRPQLVELVGEDAEALVYLYGSCHRTATWPNLARDHTVLDRFTGTRTTLDGAQLSEFADLSIVNELDVLDHTEKASAFIDAVEQLLAACHDVASARVRAEAVRALRHHR